MIERLYNERMPLYRKAADKLKDGRLSVVGAANKLIKLGAKTSVKKSIPEAGEPLRTLAGEKKADMKGDEGAQA